MPDIREIMNDHSLAERFYLRQAGDDTYTGFCPWCRSAQLGVDPRENRFKCYNPNCRAEGDWRKLDKVIRMIKARQNGAEMLTM
jgi:hypothetical protein